MNITQKQKGILFMILSALSFASMQVVVRMSREIPTMEQICVRNLFILIVSFFIIRKKRGSYYGPKKYQPYLFGRSFFGFLGLITLFYASSHAAQGDVTVLNKLSPIFVTLLAAVFMKEKLSPIQIPALALSVIGAFIVFRPNFQSDPFPLVVALLSAITSGVAYTFLGYFKGKVDGITVIMHFSTFSVFGSLPFVISNFVMPDPHQFMLLMLISLDVALVSLPFLMAGDYLAKYELFKNKFNITMLVAGFMWIIPLGMKLHIELATRSYPMGPVCVLEAIGGSVCVAGFFCFLEKKGITSSALSWLGRNSMVVLAVHCLEMMYFDWDRYVFSVLPVADMWWMAAGVKVVGIVVVAWIVVVVRDMVKRKNNT